MDKFDRYIRSLLPEEQTIFLDRLLDLAKPREVEKPKLIHFAETVEDAKKLIATEGQIIGLRSGWDSVDQMFMGLRAGQLIVVYGPTKHRKSMFVQNLAANIALQDNPVLFVGLELIAEENTERWLTMGYDNLPIVYPEKRSPTYKDIDALVAAAVADGIKLVVIDHLHMWRANGQNPAAFITEVCQEMKRVALEYRVPLILVSHISGDKDATGPPNVNRLKESTSIAQLADKVVCVYSPGVEYDQPDTTVELSIPLSRRVPNIKHATLNIMRNARLTEPAPNMFPTASR